GHRSPRRHGAQHRAESRREMSRLRRYAASARQVRSVSVVLLMLAFVPRGASAQPYLGSDHPHRGTFELGGGATFTGGYDAGSAKATLTRPGSATPLTFFPLDGRLPGTPRAGGRLRVVRSGRRSVE